MKLTAERLVVIVNRYLKLFPNEQAKLALLIAQLTDNEVMNDRKNFRGHITASGLVISPDTKKVLLIHHKGSGNWQQPGGHWEPDEPDPLLAAEREVIEETAVKIGSYLPLDSTSKLLPLDIDTHWIPKPRHADEQPHYHHDFLYAFTAASEQVEHQAEEVYGAAWFVFTAPECATEKMQRALAKLQAHNVL